MALPSGNQGREPRNLPSYAGPRGFLQAGLTGGLITSKNSPDLKSSAQVIVREAQRGMRISQRNLDTVMKLERVHG